MKSEDLANNERCGKYKERSDLHRRPNPYRGSTERRLGSVDVARPFIALNAPERFGSAAIDFISTQGQHVRRHGRLL